MVMSTEKVNHRDFQENSGTLQKLQRISEGSMMAVVDIVDTVDTQARASVTNRNQDMVSWLHDMGSHVYKCHRM
jgi:hypothetical protein